MASTVPPRMGFILNLYKADYSGVSSRPVYDSLYFFYKTNTYLQAERTDSIRLSDVESTYV